MRYGRTGENNARIIASAREMKNLLLYGEANLSTLRSKPKSKIFFATDLVDIMRI
jgi:hypothetical protein